MNPYKRPITATVTTFAFNVVLYHVILSTLFGGQILTSPGLSLPAYVGIIISSAVLVSARMWYAHNKRARLKKKRIALRSKIDQENMESNKATPNSPQSDNVRMSSSSINKDDDVGSIDFNPDYLVSSPINFGNGKSPEENKRYEKDINDAMDEFLKENGIDIKELKKIVDRIKEKTKDDPVEQLRRLKKEVFTDDFMSNFNLREDDFIKFSRLFLAPIASEDILQDINTEASKTKTLKRVRSCVGGGCAVYSATAYLILERLGLEDIKIVDTITHASLALVADTIKDGKSFVLLLDPSAEKSSEVFSLDEYFTVNEEYFDLKAEKKR